MCKAQQKGGGRIIVVYHQKRTVSFQLLREPNTRFKEGEQNRSRYLLQRAVDPQSEARLIAEPYVDVVEEISSSLIIQIEPFDTCNGGRLAVGGRLDYPARGAT